MLSRAGGEASADAAVEAEMRRSKPGDAHQHMDNGKQRACGRRG